MKKSVYKEKSSTSEGRKNLHTELLSEIKQRLDKLVENVPDSNNEKINAMFSVAMKKMESQGNSNLFSFFADEEVGDKEFICYIQDIIKDRL